MIPVLIAIDNHSDKPLYEQITGQIRTQVFNGALRGGEQLPSIRALARDLQVSIITTKRAYEDLEREGILRTIAGRGTFVSTHPPDRVRKLRLEELEGELDRSASKARELGLSRGEFLALCKARYGGPEKMEQD